MFGAVPDLLPPLEAMMDADTADEQARVLEAVRAGHSLSLRASSATTRRGAITRLIGAALEHDRTVLWLTEGSYASAEARLALDHAGFGGLHTDLDGAGGLFPALGGDALEGEVDAGSPAVPTPRPSPADIAGRSAKLGSSLRGLNRALAMLHRGLCAGAPPPLTVAAARRLLDTCDYLASAPEAVDPQALLDPVWSERRGVISAIAEQALTLVASRRELDGVVIPDAWERDLGAVWYDLQASTNDWSRRLSPRYRKAVRALEAIAAAPLPDTLEDKLALLDRLLRGQRAQQVLRAHGDLGRRAFGSVWRDDATDWRALPEIERWQRDGDDPQLVDGAPALLKQIRDPAHIGELATPCALLLETAVEGARTLFGDLGIDLAHAFEVESIDAIPLMALDECLRAIAASPEAAEATPGHPGPIPAPVVVADLQELSHWLSAGTAGFDIVMVDGIDLQEAAEPLGRLAWIEQLVVVEDLPSASQVQDEDADTALA